jgi:hypothetical protein
MAQQAERIGEVRGTVLGDGHSPVEQVSPVSEREDLNLYR